MFVYMLLDSMKLEMPTMSIKSSIPVDPDTEEEIHIKLMPIETICHVRHIVNIENEKLPLTISLIGNGQVYFGIKAVTFNRIKMCENGVFLRVDTEEWKLDDEAISQLQKHKRKDPLKYFYSLPAVLETKGFEFIFRNLKFNQEKLPFIENPFGDMTNIDVFSKRDLDNF